MKSEARTDSKQGIEDFFIFYAFGFTEKKKNPHKKITCLKDIKESTFTLLLESLSKQFEIFLANRLTRRTRLGHFFFFASLTHATVSRKPSVPSNNWWHSSTSVVVVWHQQFRFKILLIHRNVAIYGVVTLKACDDRLTSNISGWLSSSVEVVRVYCIIRNDAATCFFFVFFLSGSLIYIYSFVCHSCKFSCIWLESKIVTGMRFFPLFAKT